MKLYILFLDRIEDLKENIFSIYLYTFVYCIFCILWYEVSKYEIKKFV